MGCAIDVRDRPPSSVAYNQVPGHKFLTYALIEKRGEYAQSGQAFIMPLAHRRREVIVGNQNWKYG